MKKYLAHELNQAIDSVIGELRQIPEFTGIYIAEAPEGGAIAVVQLHPMTEAAQQRVQQMLAEYPLQFRNIAIAEAF